MIVTGIEVLATISALLAFALMLFRPRWSDQRMRSQSYR